MNPPESSTTISVKPATDTHTRLSGPWLWTVRVAWVAIAMLMVVMQVAGQPLTFNSIRTPCTQQPCALPLQVTPDAVRELREQYGISLDFWAWLSVIMEGILGLLFVGVAMLIFWRRSDDWIALLASLWLALIFAIISPTPQILANTYSLWHWPLTLLRVTELAATVCLFFLFPNGRFVPRWTRWLTVALLAVVGIGAVAGYSISTSLGIFVIALAIGAGAQIYRYRRVSGPLQRQQTKWVVLGIAGMAVPMFVFLLIGLVNPTLMMGGGSASAQDLVFILIVVPLFVVIPISIFPVVMAMSVLRYRLWDVDFVVNRSLVYGGLTMVLLGLFGVSLFAISLLFQNFVGGPLVAVAVSASVFGLIFNPTRRWLRNVVDRRFYGIKVDYRQTSTPTPSPVAASGILRTQMGAYEGLEPIGRGGMAEIYKARHPALDKTVAIKVLPHALAKQPDFRKRFEREARVVSGLKHPNIVQVYDFGEAEGTAFMVMEYIHGPDLGEVIRQDAPLTLERARAVLGEVASALDYAHAQGLVHRDVKPSNVMIEPATASGTSQTERAVLMDFGIARILGGNTYLTATGMVGTFDYIAPEQIHAASNVDGRADIYSLGVMTYQMLTGKLPFEAGHPAALLIAHLNQPCPDPRERVHDLPDRAASAILRAMAKKPDQRFSTAGEFVTALG